MNYSSIRRIMGLILQFEAAFLLLPCATALIYRETEGLAYLAVAVVCAVLGTLLVYFNRNNETYYTKEGFVAVALSWIVLSVFGAAPFVLSGDVASYTDALFETISGFTTTGASALTSVEDLSHASLMWRSFTHWVGGMGVIVFILAVMPMTGGYNMHLMKAESPGPSVGKLVPKIRQTAMILYGIYFGMTVIECILLLLAGMSPFDALCLTFGTAGTGGFAVKNSGLFEYTMLQQGIITVFMIAFGVNFNFYYYLLLGKTWEAKKQAFRMSEVKAYLGIILFCILSIAWNIRGYFGSFFEAVHHSAFQVGSIITTTGYATADFNLWPQYSRNLLVLIMFIGACAGSTGGGMKVSRVLILLKSAKQEILHFIHPRRVSVIKLDGKAVDKETVRGVNVYLAAYMLIFVVSVVLITMFDKGSLETIITSVVATFNNIGPGLDAVGATGNYNAFLPVTKYILMFDMLAGRLELFPMLVIFVPSIWIPSRKKKKNGGLQ
ncbi:MAG: TrkH family potassium uptake protein [bacterium]